MKIFRWAVLAVLVSLSGCCAYPGLFGKVHRSMETVQSFYEPLIQEDLEKNETVRRAVVAADTTLLLAGELQQQWCPDPQETGQLELQAQQAVSLARDAGVQGAGASPDAPKAAGQ
jgi:hypothetical protein